MTTTIERTSPANEAPKTNIEGIDDVQLRKEISDKIDTLKVLYKSYLSDPNQIPDEWKKHLGSVEASDYETVLAELCIKSEGYFPDFTEDENPPAATHTLYNQIREVAYERLTSEEKTASDANATDPILQKRMKSRMYGSLNTSRQSRPTKVDGSSFFANEIPTTVENSSTKKPELDEAFIAELETDLDEIAASYAAKLAKESDRSLGQLFHERSDSRIREELIDMMGGIATQLMDKAEVSGLNAAERDSLIETKLTEVTETVIQKMADARMKEYGDSSAIRKFIYSKWSSWGEQGRAGKVKQAAVMGAISAPIALAAAPVAGIAVGAGLAGAMIATGSRSLGRGLISAHINQKANAPENINNASTDIRSKVLEYQQQGEDKKPNSFEVLDIIDSTVDKYRRRNRRRVLGGVGIAMSVGLVSATLAEYISDTTFGSSPANASEKAGLDRHPLSIFEKENNNGGLADAGEDSRVDMGAPIESDSSGADAGNEATRGSDAVGGHNTQTPEHITGKLGREGMFEGQFGTRHLSPEGKKAALEAFDGYRVKSGDSLWSLSEQLCREQGISQPTVYEIDATKDLLLNELKANGSVNETGELIAGSRLSTH